MMYRAAILTASDKGARGEREDLSAQAIREVLAGLGQSGGPVIEVVTYRVVPDELEMIKESLLVICQQEKVDLILTTGGTGLGPRDVTPEATLAVVERLVPGIPEVMRATGMTKTPHAMLSRAVAGVRGRTLIINLPGSPRAVRECLEAILPALPHALEIVSGRGGECARP